MKLKNQNVREDGTLMLKYDASAGQEEAKETVVKEEPVAEEKPVKKARNASKKAK